MRVTGNHLIDVGAAATQKAEQQVATATGVASSGLRVQGASDDPAAWALARRTANRQTVSDARGTAIASSRERLQTTDGALSTISDLVARARELAIEGASDTTDPSGRATMAAQVQAFFAEALSAANTTTSDGEYVLAGARSNVAPFDAGGVYQGDAGVRAVQIGEGLTAPIGVAGSALTTAGGPVDVLPELARLAAALSSNNVTGIRAAIDTLAQAGQQVSVGRGDAGAGLNALDDAESSRQTLNVTLATTVSRAIEADPIAAASDLAKASNALEVAQAVTARAIALARPPQS